MYIYIYPKLDKQSNKISLSLEELPRERTYYYLQADSGLFE